MRKRKFKIQASNRIFEEKRKQRSTVSISVIKPLLFCIKKFSLTKLESLLTEKVFLKRLENEEIKAKKLDPKLLSSKHTFFDTLTDQIKFSDNKFQVVLFKTVFCFNLSFLYLE